MGEQAKRANAGTRKAKAGGRERIMEAAAGVFAEAGFEGARVDEIARIAGVNKAMLYYHVGNKAKLYEAVLLTWMDALIEELGRAIVPSLPPEAKLVALAETFEEMARRSPQYPQLLVREFTSGGRNLSPVVMGRLASLIRMEGRFLDEGRRAGELREVSPLTVHILLAAGTVMHLMALKLRFRAKEHGVTGIPRPSERPSRLITDLLLNGLKVKHGNQAAQAGGKRQIQKGRRGAKRNSIASRGNKEQPR